MHKEDLVLTMIRLGVSLAIIVMHSHRVKHVQQAHTKAVLTKLRALLLILVILPTLAVVMLVLLQPNNQHAQLESIKAAVRVIVILSLQDIWRRVMAPIMMIPQRPVKCSAVRVHSKMGEQEHVPPVVLVNIQAQVLLRVQLLMRVLAHL